MKDVVSAKNRVICSVKALLKHNNRYLLVKEVLRKGEVWDLPGGKIDYGEDPEAALIRELREETGLNVTVGESVGVWHFISQHHQDHVICHTFVCTVETLAGQELHIDLDHNPADEHLTEYRWVVLDELVENVEFKLAPSLLKLLRLYRQKSRVRASAPVSTKQLLDFYVAAEKLKTTLRHSWLNDGKRQESVAEHTWMMSLLAIVLLPHFDQELDERKLLRMIALHDLAESVTNDSPAWENKDHKQQKHQREQIAMNEVLAHLDTSVQQGLLALWQEYEERTSPEAKFIKSLDCFDVLAQHNVAPIETWTDQDFEWQLLADQDAHFAWDKQMREIKNAIDRWSIAKATATNQQHRLYPSSQVELSDEK